MTKFSKRLVLKFPHRLVDQPIICKLVRDYNLDFNILKAYVTPNEEGLLVMELVGKKDDYDKGVAYLKDIGLNIQFLGQDVKRNDDKCTHCGACIVICPTEALCLDKKTRKVDFYDDKCIACELCIKMCPAQAMEIHF